MKTIHSSRRRRYVVIISIVLIAVALIVWMVVSRGGPAYNLTIASSAGGSVTTPGEGTFTYDEGTVVNLVATPDAGYRFVEWTGNVSTITNINAAATNITMNSAYSVTAEFVKQYHTTIFSTTGGSVTTPGEGTFTYDEGTVVNLVATPDTGYHFVEWTGNVATVANVNAAATNITMNGDYSIMAEFVKQYDLTIFSTEGGSVTTPGEGTFTYATGTVVNLVATPDTGYHFVNWTGDVSAIANVYDATTTTTMNGDYEITANFEVEFMVAAGQSQTVGLKSNGTVVAVGDNSAGQCNVGGWTGIIQVATGGFHAAGIKSNGTAVAVGSNSAGECNVGGWTDIVQVAIGFFHTVGLKSDGTVVAVGSNAQGQCNVGSWTDITQIAAGGYYTVGLKSNGTVVAVGSNFFGQCNVGGWTGITQIAAGGFHTVGLKANGTVVAVGDNSAGQCNIGGWTGITQVAASDHTLGLKANGTVVAVGDNYYGQCDVTGWTGIIQVAAGPLHTVGVKSDGTVVAVGDNYYGQCDVSGWDLD